MRTWAISLAITITLAISPSIYSADVTQPVDIDFRLEALSEKLTQKTVIQSFQDSRGILWFVTQEGLNKYNGYTLENFRYSPTNQSSLSSNEVTRITEDKTGTIWIATLGGGLNKYNSIDNTFTSLLTTSDREKSPHSNYIATIYTDSSGELWLGYNDAFSVFDTLSGTFSHYVSGNRGIPKLGLVNRFTQTSDGRIWAATQNGLLEINRSSGTLLLHVPKGNLSNQFDPVDLLFVEVDSNDNIWTVSRDLGVQVFNTNSQKFYRLKHEPSDERSISSDVAYDAFRDSEGRMWIATYTGLNLYDDETDSFIKFTKDNTRLPSNRINSVYQSREGKFWVGTYYGLAGGTPNLFTLVNSTNSHLSSNSVNAFSETEDGSLWVGTDDGLNRLRPEDDTFEWINESSFPRISKADVMSLLADDEHLWIGTYNAGLNRLNIYTGEVELFEHNSKHENSIGANGITSLLKTNDGKIIVGTFGGGLSIYRPEKNDFLNFRNRPGESISLSNDNVIALFQDSLGLIWVGTEKGLNSFNIRDGTFKTFYSDIGSDKSLSSDMVWAFYEDEKQQLWLGTKGGSLNRWGSEDRFAGNPRFSHYAENISLPSSNIYGIKADLQGNLWLSHNRGITRFNPATMESHQYGIRDGLQDTEFNMGAAFQSASGTIYFGGNNGFNTVPPDGVKEKNIPPTVAISDIKIMNESRAFEEPYHALKKIKLDYEDRMLTVEFFAADYSNTDLIKYAYKLEGLNSDWIISPDARIASFTTLPPGEYNLKMAASSPDGVWNWDALDLPIKVSPPPWQSGIAYTVYALFILAMIFWIYTRQRRQAALATERQRELETKVRERTSDLLEAQKAAEEANKAKSDFLATMSHEIRTPMHGMIGMTELLLHTNLTDQQQQFAKAAHSSGEALLNLINEILDFSKVEASRIELEEVEFNIVELIDEICYLQGEPADRKCLSLNGIFENLASDHIVGDPTKLRQVIMNLVSNSIKFTHSGNVDVRVNVEACETENEKQSMLRIAVEDQGIGMDHDTQSKIFDAFTQADASTTREYGGTGLGLAISSHYIELMGGTIEVDSIPTVGTKIEINVPVKAGQPSWITKDKTPIRIAMVEASNQPTYDMIVSHLALLGISSQKYDSGLKKPINIDLILIDYDTQDFNKKVKELSDFNFSGLRIIATPLTKAAIPDFCADWAYVTKPLTLSSLKSATDSVISQGPSSRFQTKRQKDFNELKRILVAEDVETNQKIAKEMITLLGYAVDIAANGEEALNKYQKNNYELIFMDCQMPIMDGYEATRKIREVEDIQKSSRIPIIALTAGFDRNDKEKCRKSGMDYYLTKPFSVSDLRQVLNKFLDKNDDELSRYLVEDEAVGDLSLDKGDEFSQDIFNISAIDNIKEVERQTGRSLLPSIFSGFVEQMDEKLSEMSGQIKSGDAISVSRTAHAIKSMSANIGAEKIRLISSQIELAGKSDNLVILGQELERLMRSYSEFKKSFEAAFLERESPKLRSFESDTM
jgi:signal transduction histidine kinase/ligand-binding sensor domain-containing protein/CheY-like chemotaxis protein/HPt (histidine-containing phosphotransfer) domain-containing protein